jgi:hypothetical protein
MDSGIATLIRETATGKQICSRLDGFELEAEFLSDVTTRLVPG